MAQTPQGANGPGRYEIRVKGLLAARWADWFDGLTLTHDDGITVLEGPLVDQSALHGVLRKLADLGLPLLSVTPTPEPSQDPTDPSPS